MAVRYKRIKMKGRWGCLVASGKKKGRFAKNAKCNLKTQKTRGKRKAAAKRGKTRKPKNVFRDKAGRCHKNGKYASNATCKRYGI
jgi:hypothetical protein